MTKAVLRKRVHEYVDQVDENILSIVFQLLEREISLSEYDLSPADKRLIEKRTADFASGKDVGVLASAASKKIRSKIKAEKK